MGTVVHRRRGSGSGRSPGAAWRVLGTVALVALVALVVGCSSGHRRVVAPVPRPVPAAVVPPSNAPLPTVPPTTSTSVPVPTAVVAKVLVPKLAIFTEPGAPTPTWTLPNPRPLGGPLVLIATEQRPGWVQALLPVRPNGTRGWVRDTDVSLSRHHFHIHVELGAHRITVYSGLQVIDAEDIGVGTGATPTPGGLYYTIDFVRLQDPTGPYGPYAYGLSGFSDVLTSFAGGPGQLAIHGTNEPGGLGSNVSHGCIRMSNAGIARLAGVLPLAVPVDVSA